jgi:type I restriction enzyme S subunit
MSNRPEWVPLSSVLQTIIDNRGKSVPTVESGFPLIATNCIKETSIYPTFENVRYVSCETLNSWFRAHLEPNDILFVNKGTPGRVCLVPDPVPFCAAQDMIGLRADPEKIDFRYLFAFLRSSWVKQTIANNHVGLVIPHFRKRDLDTLSVPIRARKEQEKIGELYLLLSKKIELNNQINAELETVAKLLYDYWFVQFDFPMTKAQAASLGRPELEGKPYRTSGGKMVHNPTLNREIPEGWEAGNVFKMSKLGGGGTPIKEKPEYWRGHIPFFTPTDALPVPFVLDTEAHITAEGLEKSSTRLFPTGTLFLTARGSVGKVMITTRDMAMSQSCYALTPHEGISSQFLYFQTLGLMDYLKIKSSGSIFKSIVTDDIKHSPTIIPPKSVIVDFSDKTGAMFEQIKNHQILNQELAQLRDWLLPMLMNGQVTVG